MTELALMDGVSAKSARGRDDSDDLPSSLWYPRCWSVGSATGRHESKTDRDRKDIYLPALVDGDAMRAAHAVADVHRTGVM